MNPDLLNAWDDLNCAIKNLEVATLVNLQVRVSQLMEARTKFDKMFMDHAVKAVKHAST